MVTGMVTVSPAAPPDSVAVTAPLVSFTLKSETVTLPVLVSVPFEYFSVPAYAGILSATDLKTEVAVYSSVSVTSAMVCAAALLILTVVVVILVARL